MLKQGNWHPISFISEHSVEYVLVPKMKDVLKEKFDIVVPIYPSLLREGSRIARTIHKDDKFKVVGLYPRRPKFYVPLGSAITIKLNIEILKAAKYGIQLGIPIIAGCPLVKNLWELDDSHDCIWIKLDQAFNDDLEIKISNLDIKKSVYKELEYIFKNEENLLAYFLENAIQMSFNEAISAFRQIKHAYWEHNYFSYFRILSGYKPVYFLLR